MTNERIAEIRRLATPATNARQLTRMLHETLDALESVTAAVQEDWTSGLSVTMDGTVEYGPGLAEQLLASDPAVITEPLSGIDRTTEPSVLATIGAQQGSPLTVERIEQILEDTRPMKRPGKERK